MAMSEQERLPPEPRLQVARVSASTVENGRVNLELREPQAEYRELQKAVGKSLGSTDRRIRKPER